MPRPKKNESEKRVRVTITTLPEVIVLVDRYRGYMTRSEFIHRRLIDWFNERHPPEEQIHYWEPEKSDTK